MTIFTKSALAAELGITPARVSQYVKRGLPVRRDGRLSREEALKWIASMHSDRGNDKGASRARALTTGKTGPTSSRRPARAESDPPSSPQRPALPPAYASADRCGDAEDRAAVLGMMRLAYATPATVAPLAVMLGIKPSLAYHLTALVRIALLQEVEDVLAEMAIEPGGVLWEPKAFRQVDWAALAHTAGEAFDIEAWRSAMHERARALKS